MANYISRRGLYRWSVVTPDGEAAIASNGLSLACTGGHEALLDCDLVIVCGGTDVRAAVSETTSRLLRQCAGRGVTLGALCTGAFALASAGVLDGYRYAIHWENLAAIRDEFPKVSFAQEVFIVDREALPAQAASRRCT